MLDGELNTFFLFGALTLYSFVYGASWSIAAVRLRVDAGLFLIVLTSIALRQPFTLQYAREKVSSEFWNSPTFVRVNYAITFTWARAFAAIAYSTPNRTLIPRQTEHGFHSKASADSTANRAGIPRLPEREFHA